TDPTDRSIPPEMMINRAPKEMTPVTVMLLRRTWRFLKPRNLFKSPGSPFQAIKRMNTVKTTKSPMTGPERAWPLRNRQKTPARKLAFGSLVSAEPAELIHSSSLAIFLNHQARHAISQKRVARSSAALAVSDQTAHGCSDPRDSVW